MITTGEGGMATTETEEYAERMRIMSLHGISRDAWERYTAEGSWYYGILYPKYFDLLDCQQELPCRGNADFKKCPTLLSGGKTTF